MFENSSLVSSVSRVKNALIYSLEKEYNINDKEVAIGILKLQGMYKDNFDFINNIENVISKGIADASIDTNANKNETSISGITVEATNPVNKVIGHRYLYRKMNELYGKSEAKRLSGKMYDYSIAISDSTKILLPYCYAVDATKLVLEGRPSNQLPSVPPKRLSSYIAALCETIHQLSNHLAGAIAVGSFFLDTTHVLIYKEGYSLNDIKNNKMTRKYIENCYQSFIHSINHLSRNAIESPFTNISIFDRVKLNTLVEDMMWYFPDHKKEYIIDYIMETQRLFMEFFEQGDKVNGERPFRFPVVTINISKDASNELLDKDFLKDICKREIYRYNILVSEGSKVASCCRLLSDSEMLSMGGQVNSFGSSGISLGSHRVCTINFNRLALQATSYEDYKLRLKNVTEDCAKILKAHKELLKDTVKMNIQPFIKNHWLRLERMFSTIGVLGIYEANKTLRHKFKVASDVIGDSLILLNTQVKEMSKKYNITCNIEQIPGESMAVRLCAADKLIYGPKLVPYELYANQFVPLWENVSIWERMEIDGKYNKLFTGGSICHFNLGEHLTSKQVERIITHACNVGCEHFALNSIYSQCENKHTSFGNHKTCPVCKSKIVERFTRVIGFMTPISSWNKVRREWEFPKRQFGAIE